jgi:hypothetical protein
MNASMGPRWRFHPRTVGCGIPETIDMDEVVQVLALARLPLVSVSNRWRQARD